MLRNQPKWEVELAIVNFRYAPQGLAPQQQDKRSMVISQRMVEAGFACVLTAQLKGRTVLLICSIHPAATEEEIRYTIRSWTNMPYVEGEMLSSIFCHY